MSVLISTSTSSVLPTGQGTGASSKGPSSHLAPIFAGAVGGATIILIIVICILLYRRRLAQRAAKPAEKQKDNFARLRPDCDNTEKPSPYLLTRPLLQQEGAVTTGKGHHDVELDLSLSTSESGHPTSSWAAPTLIGDAPHRWVPTVGGERVNQHEISTRGRKQGRVKPELRALNAVSASSTSDLVGAGTPNSSS